MHLVMEAADLRTFPARNLSVAKVRWVSPGYGGLGGGGLDESAGSQSLCLCDGFIAGLADQSFTYVSMQPGRSWASGD